MDRDPLATPPAVDRGPAVPQRHNLTVLFTDLCGSTQLGRQMELEQTAELLAQLRAIWHEAAAQHGGLVLRTQGDGAMIVFGYPQTGEMDGLHAVTAALQIHAKVRQISVDGLPPGWIPMAHSGIHAGVVLLSAGDLERGRLDLTGDMANTAAKVEQAAAPDEILSTRHALGPHAGMFLLRDAHLDLPADWTAGAVVSVLGRGAAQRRFDATAQRGLTPLVARDEVLRALDDFLAAPGPAAQRCAVISAPAGMGKTRLLEELALRPALQHHVVLRGSCENTLGSEVLQPFAQMLRAWLQEGRSEARAGAEAALAQGRVDVYRDFFASLDAEHGLLQIDDWQWADDASRRLVQALLQSPQSPRLLITARPREDGSTWISEALQLSLRPFNADETTLAVQRWLHNADPFLTARIHHYAGGVPLFVEEICHSGTSDELGRLLQGRTSAQQSWVAALVASRLGRLPPGPAAVVRAASVIGNEVPLWLLEIGCQMTVDPALLACLADADFLYLDPQGEVLRFKHGITRDAVYGCTGLQERRALHRRVQASLLARAGDAGRSAHLEALAHHSWGAGHWADAATFAEAAGDKAAAAFAMDRAATHYRTAMDALDHLTESQSETRLRWCRLASKLGMICIFDPLSLGNDIRPFERAVALSREEGDEQAHALALYWLGYIQYGLGRHLEARKPMLQALALGRSNGDAPLAAQIEATLGQALAATCEYDEALQRMDAAIESKRQRSRPGSGVAIGSAYTLACKGSVLADRGAFAAAQDCFDEAIRLLGSSTHPVGNSVRNWITVAYIWQGRWDQAERVAMESVRIAENTQALLLLAVSRSTLGYARWSRDGDPSGVQLLDDAVGWMEARRGQMFTSLHFGWLAEASVVLERRQRARALAAHVLWRARQGERLGEAVACRAQARVAQYEGDWQTAARWLDRAEHSARLRASVREAALNQLARGQLLQVRDPQADSQPAINEARARLHELGVQLPFWAIRHPAS